MSTPARSVRNQENVIAGDLTTGARIKSRLLSDPVSTPRIKSAFTPGAGPVDSCRKALENVGNNRSSSTSDIGEEKVFRVPETPKAAPSKLCLAKFTSEIAEPEDDYPEIETMPASFKDEDDYEDIWSKSCRFTVDELDRIGRWCVPLPDVKDCKFESSPVKAIDYEPMPDCYGSCNDHLVPELDNSPMAYIPPLSPVS